MMPDGGAVFAQAFAMACRPRKRMLVSQWNDAERVLSSKSSPVPGRWRTSRNPMLREIMDGLSLHSSVREITVKKSSQVGVTEGPFIGAIGYYMHYDPAPMMVLMPTIESRDTWRIQKLNPLFTDTPAVRNVIGGLRRRDASFSKDAIDYPGGVLFLAGGNSPNSYAQKSAKVVMMDDLDRFPAEVGNEGDPVELGRSRYKAFPYRYKFFKASTPTIDGASLIDREYDDGDQRHYHIQCPHCGEFQYLKWANVFADEAATEAWYACGHCGAEIPESMKANLFAERGHGGTAHWKPERPEIKHHRSYHISAIYAMPGMGPSWLDLVKKFRRIVRSGDKRALQVFINSDLGECWKPDNAEVKESELMRRAAEEGFTLGTVPPGFLVITMSVDTQDSWLEYKRLAWGPDEQYAVVGHGQIVGDTTLTSTWDLLEEEINKPLTNAWGKEMRPVAVAVDSRGHRTEQVKDFVMRRTHKTRVFSVQGATNRLPRAIAMTGSSPERTARGKVLKSGYMVWNVGTEYCKDYIYGKLASDGNVAREMRAFHFPTDLPEEYFNGLMAEVFDEVKKRYVQRLGSRYKRNEPIDLMAYAWAIGHHKLVRIGRNRSGNKTKAYWERLRRMLEPADAQPLAEGEKPVASDDAGEDAGTGIGGISLKGWQRG